jgi:DNA-binding beta-propeller fold protein YncE
LALSPDGNLLFATNTPAGRLEVFRIDGITLVPQASIPVGLEPVAVAARSQTQVWVVNHLSDSVSIVDISDLSSARVVQTLLVGDEPRDIVFAGPNHDRAFITTAHRGQNSPVDPELTTPGRPRADVWVFDANQLDETAAPVIILSLFSDTPRALAATPDGNTVYAAAFHSGNRTTTIPVGAIPPRVLPPPTTNFQGIRGPDVGLIVRFRRGPDESMHWLDKFDRVWDDTVRLSLPDQDVFAIDATTDPPSLGTGPSSVFQTVGTVLFNMVVNPANRKVYVSNTDAQNDTRFEGPGVFAFQESGMRSVRGHLAESHITVLDATAPKGQNVLPRHLNKHINYDDCCAPIPNPENDKSLAFPVGMAVSADGSTLYVTAFGSSKVGVFSTQELEDNTFEPDTANQINVTGGGPSGLVLGGGVLYALTRFDNSISIIDPQARREIGHVAMCNPEPNSVTEGRRFLYDAAFTSSHGDSACASCHIFGDFDSLAWDLGDPDNTSINVPGPFTVCFDIFPVCREHTFHPMKGPMTTQSLRGMDNHGPMHWRGDRTGGNDVPESHQPNTGTFDEVAAFNKFNVAFPGLVGRNAQLSDSEMQAFNDFILQVTYPPNPIRNLDNSLTTEQQNGRDFYFGPRSDTFEPCNGCHVLDPNGNSEYPEVLRPGFFGTDGRYSFEGESQLFKIPHLRNAYQKVGMFGMPPDPFFPSDPNPPTGDQVRGFGFLHDGSVDTLFRFHGAQVFMRSILNPEGIPSGEEGRLIRRQLESFILAFDSNLAPIVGQQITLTATSPDFVHQRITLLESRAGLGECDLVVKGRVGGIAAGFLYDPRDQRFVRSQSGDPRRTDAELRALATEPLGELTFSCVPPGSGSRIADEL